MVRRRRPLQPLPDDEPDSSSGSRTPETHAHDGVTGPQVLSEVLSAVPNPARWPPSGRFGLSPVVTCETRAIVSSTRVPAICGICGSRGSSTPCASLVLVSTRSC